ncbi:hypothetical protein Hanom_Chr11g00976701 [Helianthus anomalus]
MPRDCRMHPGFLLEYGEEVHVGISEEVSTLNQVTGRCFGCHMPLGPQISFQTCPKTPNIARERPDPQKREPLLQPLLSWPEHLFQWRNLHIAENIKVTKVGNLFPT